MVLCDVNDDRRLLDPKCDDQDSSLLNVVRDPVTPSVDCLWNDDRKKLTLDNMMSGVDDDVSVSVSPSRSSTTQPTGQELALQPVPHIAEPRSGLPTVTPHRGQTQTQVLRCTYDNLEFCSRHRRKGEWISISRTGEGVKALVT